MEIPVPNMQAEVKAEPEAVGGSPLFHGDILSDMDAMRLNYLSQSLQPDSWTQTKLDTLNCNCDNGHSLEASDTGVVKSEPDGQDIKPPNKLIGPMLKQWQPMEEDSSVSRSEKKRQQAFSPSPQVEGQLEVSCPASYVVAPSHTSNGGQWYILPPLFSSSVIPTLVNCVSTQATIPTTCVDSVMDMAVSTNNGLVTDLVRDDHSYRSDSHVVNTYTVDNITRTFHPTLQTTSQTMASVSDNHQALILESGKTKAGVCASLSDPHRLFQVNGSVFTTPQNSAGVCVSSSDPHRLFQVNGSVLTTPQNSAGVCASSSDPHRLFQVKGSVFTTTQNSAGVCASSSDPHRLFQANASVFTTTQNSAGVCASSSDPHRLLQVIPNPKQQDNGATSTRLPVPQCHGRPRTKSVLTPSKTPVGVGTSVPSSRAPRGSVKKRSHESSLKSKPVEAPKTKTLAVLVLQNCSDYITPSYQLVSLSDKRLAPVSVPQEGSSQSVLHSQPVTVPGVQMRLDSDSLSPALKPSVGVSVSSVQSQVCTAATTKSPVSVHAAAVLMPPKCSKQNSPVSSPVSPTSIAPVLAPQKYSSETVETVQQDSVSATRVASVLMPQTCSSQNDPIGQLQKLVNRIVTVRQPPSPQKDGPTSMSSSSSNVVTKLSSSFNQCVSTASVSQSSCNIVSRSPSSFNQCVSTTSTSSSLCSVIDPSSSPSNTQVSASKASDSSNRSHVCPLCSDVFVQASSLDVHIKRCQLIQRSTAAKKTPSGKNRSGTLSAKSSSACGKNVSGKLSSTDTSHDTVNDKESIQLSSPCARNILKDDTRETADNASLQKTEEPVDSSKSIKSSSQFGDHLNVSDTNKVLNTKNATGDNKDSFTCVICTRTFDSEQEHKKHFIDHLFRPYSCEGCSQSFEKESCLKLHELQHNQGEKPYKCDQCEQSYVFSAGLEDHRRQHVGDKPYACMTCNAAFCSTSKLTEHMRLHTEDSLFCWECCKIMESVHALKEHNRKHFFSLKDKCETCGKKLSLARLKVHRQRCNEKKQRTRHLNNDVADKVFASDVNSRTQTRDEKSFICDECGRVFKHFQVLQRHKFVHSGDKPFKCQKCEKSYTTASPLAEHFVQKHSDPTLMCDVCGKTFHFTDQLDRHKEVHANIKPYSCRICSKAFPSVRTLKLHKRIHSQNNRFSCEECGKGFRTRSALQKHTVTHSDGKPYACEVCEKRFHRSSTLHDHYKAFHLKNKPHVCNVCNRAFTLPALLRIHQRIHSDERHFVCDQCGRTFKYAQILQRHKLLHVDVKPFKCKECDRSFVTVYSLDRHRSSKHSDPKFLCDVCPKAFHSAEVLSKHKEIHTETKNYPCNVCDKIFPALRALQAHKRIHVPNNRFKCSACGKGFREAQALQKHKATHVGEEA